MVIHAYIGPNRRGMDYFVGDIHGNYSLLMHDLIKNGFNFVDDRLFATGDLIDRGPQSIKCINLLNEPWFHSVLGNHEDMLISGMDNKSIQQLHFRNGGSWIGAVSAEQLQYIEKLIKLKMPLAFTVATNYGQVGLIHAAAPDNWATLQQATRISREDKKTYLWSLKQYDLAVSKRSSVIANIDKVVHGHVNCDYVEHGKNQVWLDTLLQSGRLSVLSAKQLFT